MADNNKLYATLRVVVSRHNLKHGEHYECNIQEDGSLRVIETAPADPKPERPEHPTNLEFLSYLASMQAGESFKLGREYKPLFADLLQWTADASHNGTQFAAMVTLHEDSEPIELTISRTVTPSAPVWKG